MSAKGKAVNLASLRLSSLQRQGVEIGGRKIRPQVGPVPPNGAVFHEGVFQKDLLPRQDIIPGKNGVAGRVDHPGRNGRGVFVGPHRNPDQDGEADNEGENDPYLPPG